MSSTIAMMDEGGPARRTRSGKRSAVPPEDARSGSKRAAISDGSSSHPIGVDSPHSDDAAQPLPDSSAPVSASAAISKRTQSLGLASPDIPILSAAIAAPKPLPVPSSASSEEDSLRSASQASAVSATSSSSSLVPSSADDDDCELALEMEPIAAAPQRRLNFIDIDALGEADPQNCSEYAADIQACFRESEQCTRSMDDYMDSVQRDINASMRSILIDWLNEVAQEYNLQAETLFLAVNLIDRFLSLYPVQRSKLQLIGVTAMLIAAKFEEVMPPAVDDFVYITDNTYTRDEVLRTESLMLNTIHFSVVAATCMDFLRRFLRAAQADRTCSILSQYLCELTLQEYSFLRFLPSQIAACAVSLALSTLKLPSWNPTMEHYIEYTPRQLDDCMKELFRVYTGATKNSLQAVKDKFSHSRWMRVSNLVPPSNLPPAFALLSPSASSSSSLASSSSSPSGVSSPAASSS